MKVTTHKIALLGPTQSGKSAFLDKLVENLYRVSFMATIGAEYKAIELVLDPNNTCTLQIWNIAGDKRYIGLALNYLNSTNSIILFIEKKNITDSDSFSLEYFQRAMHKLHSNENRTFYLLITKDDKKELDQDRLRAIKERFESVLRITIKACHSISSMNDWQAEHIEFMESVAKELHEEMKISQEAGQHQAASTTTRSTTTTSTTTTSTTAASTTAASTTAASTTATSTTATDNTTTPPSRHAKKFRIFWPPSYLKTFAWITSLSFVVGLIIIAATPGFHTAEKDLNAESNAHRGLHQLAGVITLATMAVGVFLIGVLGIKLTQYRERKKGVARATDGVELGEINNDETTPLISSGRETAAAKRSNGSGPVICDTTFFTPARTGVLLTLFVMGMAAAVIGGKGAFPKMWSTLVTSAWSHTVAAVVALAASAGVGSAATVLHRIFRRTGCAKFPENESCNFPCIRSPA